MGSNTETRDARDALEREIREFTEEQVEALEATRAKLNFTPEESEEILRKSAATTEWIASAETLEEQERRGAQAWARNVERPRMTRRIAAARRPCLAAVIVPRTDRRQRERRPAAGRRAASSSSTSSQDPGSDSDPEPPIAELWRWADPASWRGFLADRPSFEGVGR